MRSLTRSLAGTLPEAQDLEIAAEAALLGGMEVLRYYQKNDLHIEDKSAGPVTQADRSSHASICHFLEASCPSDSVLSEEAGEHPELQTPRIWIVDPLDGTREFIEGIGEFSVMVGLAVYGSACLGAVFRPDADTLYLGLTDHQSWRLTSVSPKTEELRLPRRGRETSPQLRLVRSRSHYDERLRQLEMALCPSSVIVSGSVGVKCALIAEGQADAYVHPVPYLKEWDTCAPEAILRGAGGRVSDCLGRPLVYGKPEPVQPAGIFAATRSAWLRLAPRVIETVQKL